MHGLETCWALTQRSTGFQFAIPFGPFGLIATFTTAGTRTSPHSTGELSLLDLEVSCKPPGKGRMHASALSTFAATTSATPSTAAPPNPPKCAASSGGGGKTTAIFFARLLGGMRPAEFYPCFPRGARCLQTCAVPAEFQGSINPTGN